MRHKTWRDGTSSALLSWVHRRLRRVSAAALAGR